MGESDKSAKYNCGELSLQPSHHAHVDSTWEVILALILLTSEKGPQTTPTITHKRSEWGTAQVRGNKYKKIARSLIVGAVKDWNLRKLLAHNPLRHHLLRVTLENGTL